MPRNPAVALPARRGVALDRATLSVLLLLAGVAVQTRQAVAAEATQTFGPGKVNCQVLTGTEVDCLLASNWLTPDNTNVATFSVTALPRGEQALFRKWCLAAANECTATVTGWRASPQSSRLSTVTSVHWTRLSAPVNEAAARVPPTIPTPATTGPAIQPAR